MVFSVLVTRERFTQVLDSFYQERCFVARKSTETLVLQLE